MTYLNFQEAMQRAKNASFEPLPDGPYDVVCIEAVPTESSTNKPMIKLKYQVESGPQAGKKVFSQQVFSADNDNALSIFFRYMAFHGLDEGYFSQNPGWEQVAASLVGRRVRLVLGHRVWQGVTRNEVNQVLPPSDPAAGLPGGMPNGGIAAGLPGGVAGVPQMTVPSTPAYQPPVQQAPVQQAAPIVQQPVMQTPVAQPPVAQPPQSMPILQQHPQDLHGQPVQQPAPAPVPQPQPQPEPTGQLAFDPLLAQPQQVSPPPAVDPAQQLVPPVVPPVTDVPQVDQTAQPVQPQPEAVAPVPAVSQATTDSTQVPPPALPEVEG